MFHSTYITVGVLIHSVPAVFYNQSNYLFLIISYIDYPGLMLATPDRPSPARGGEGSQQGMEVSKDCGVEYTYKHFLQSSSS